MALAIVFHDTPSLSVTPSTAATVTLGAGSTTWMEKDSAADSGLLASPSVAFQTQVVRAFVAVGVPGSQRVVVLTLSPAGRAGVSA